jgi:hypothetical protein
MCSHWGTVDAQMHGASLLEVEGVHDERADPCLFHTSGSDTSAVVLDALTACSIHFRWCEGVPECAHPPALV